MTRPVDVRARVWDASEWLRELRTRRGVNVCGRLRNTGGWCLAPVRERGAACMHHRDRRELPELSVLRDPATGEPMEVT